MEVEKRQPKSHKMPEGFDIEQSLTAIEALLAHSSKSKRDSLFSETATRFLMDITAFKIPEGQNHIYNIVLPNSPYPDTLDILLIIPDEYDQSTPEKDQRNPDVVVNEMKDKLVQVEIPIREVLTVSQLKNEYSTFEAKRKLAGRVDLVLAHQTVFKRLSNLLGREFYKKKKFQLAIDCKSPDLTKEITVALKKTVLNISLKGSISTVPIGHDNLSAPELADNVSKITNWLMRQFPGGWQNILKLSVYVAGVPPLIIYLSEGSRNDVWRPTKKGARSHSPVEGELSTQPGRRVRVHPQGQIEVFDDVPSQSESENDISEEESD